MCSILKKIKNSWQKVERENFKDMSKNYNTQSKKIQHDLMDEKESLVRELDKKYRNEKDKLDALLAKQSAFILFQTFQWGLNKKIRNQKYITNTTYQNLEDARTEVMRIKEAYYDWTVNDVRIDSNQKDNTAVGRVGR